MQKPRRTIRRRRLERKTDYKARFGLLKSNLPRIVFRKTNRYIIGQLVETDIAQDKIIMGVNSKDLLTHGWPKKLEGSLKSIAASYLTGYMLGKKVKSKKIIFDIGFNRNIHKSRIYAFLKGLVDAGVEIAHNKKALPDEEKIKENEKTKEIIDKIKENLNG